MNPLSSTDAKRRHLDDQDMEETASQAPTPILSFCFDVGSMIESGVSSLIVSTDAVAEPCVQSIIQGLKMTVCGHVSIDRATNATIYSSSADAGRSVLVVLHFAVPESLLYEYSLKLIDLNPKLTLALASLNNSMFFETHLGHSTDLLRKITTTIVSQQNDECLGAVPDLEAGSIVSGLCASLCNLCEPRRASFVGLVSITNSAISFESMKAFEKAWGFLEASLQVTLAKPTTTDYSTIARSDKFLSSTANMYT